MRTYYCNLCQHTVTFDVKETVKKCDCGNIFENKLKGTHHINMRNTWSGTTKVEFNTTTIGESINRMNNG